MTTKQLDRPTLDEIARFCLERPDQSFNLNSPCNCLGSELARSRQQADSDAFTWTDWNGLTTVDNEAVLKLPNPVSDMVKTIVGVVHDEAERRCQASGAAYRPDIGEEVSKLAHFTGKQIAASVLRLQVGHAPETVARDMLRTVHGFDATAKG